MLKIDIVPTTAQIPTLSKIEEVIDEGEILAFIDDSTSKIHCYTIDPFDGEVVTKVFSQDISVSDLIDATVIED